jgi:hypothetical protein
MLKTSDIIETPGWTRDRLPHELVARGLLRVAEIGVQRGEHAEQLLAAGVTDLTLVDLWAKQANYFDIANVPDAEQEKIFRECLVRVGIGAQAATACPADFFALVGNDRKTIRVLRGHSARVADQVEDGSLDAVYLDANHTCVALSGDLVAWYPKVRPGGIISGHDYLDAENCCGSEFGVRSAVRRFASCLGVGEVFVSVGHCWPNWHFTKPA